jgi:hypothetical protein
MKVLLFIPQIYSLSEMLQEGFEANGWTSIIADYQKMITHNVNRFYEKTSGLPNRMTKYWKQVYFNLINKKYIEYCEQEKPDLLLIYNNQFFFPDTINKLKKYSKIAFILGDNPLWSKTFDHNLSILKYADLVLSPDTHWQFELTMVGISNVFCDYIGYSKKHFFAVSLIPEELKKKYESDLLFIGRNYPGSSGFKRTMFLNSFAGMNLKVFGTREWERWLPYFPLLKPHFYATQGRISTEELNFAINCTKIYPIDQNPGIINGLHLRIFESIGSGALPVVEWRKDIDEVFGGLLPVIKKYSEAKEIVNYFLDSDDLRKNTIEALRKHIETKYTPKYYVKRLLERLELNKISQ